MFFYSIHDSFGVSKYFFRLFSFNPNSNGAFLMAFISFYEQIHTYLRTCTTALPPPFSYFHEIFMGKPTKHISFFVKHDQQ